MKKKKVDALIRKFQAEAERRGEERGRREERRKHENLIPAPRDGFAYLNGDPSRDGKIRSVVVMPPSYAVGYATPLDMWEMPRASSYQRLDFEAVPMALSLSNGFQVRWFHWKPIGPYPVSELAVLR